jgi:hypothetical protein
MAERKIRTLVDTDRRNLGIVKLNDSQDVDGTNNSTQSDPINGHAVRILSLDNIFRFEIGSNPVATATSAAVRALDEILQPCNPGDKVAILGGKVNITTLGE